MSYSCNNMHCKNIILEVYGLIPVAVINADSENDLAAANRHLFKEMGMKYDLTYLFKFSYKIDFENGLSEHALDHVFIDFQIRLQI
ncbi:hypothetical protein [Pedobacter sp. MW01-1-1]|uniref:hypothetical protein n=1 Tax=Pedobacter sp. MW01-1-1 TaxID=3383027 RepID=UPI003FF11606